MRHIKKNKNSEAIVLLNDWKEERKQAGQNLLYDDFNKKTELNEILRTEQGGICCYCQQRITHYQENNDEGSHNEHLIPQNGPDGQPELQAEYANLYACCNYSKGREKNKQHCGEAKGDNVIANFIQHINCDKNFKYNTLGEILPQGSFKTLSEFEKNQSLLTDKQQEALKTIKILNLNQHSLTEERKKDQTGLFQMLNRLTKQQVTAKIQIFNTQKPHTRFIDMLLYYMKQKK